jgi:hypothetical protein
VLEFRRARRPAIPAPQEPQLARHRSVLVA